VGAVPHAQVLVCVLDQDRCQRVVNASTVGRRRARVDGQADGGMGERHVIRDVHEPASRCLLQRLPAKPHDLERGRDRLELSERRRGGDEESRLGWRGEGANAHDGARILLREWRQQNAPRIRNREAEGVLLRERNDKRDRLRLDPARDEG
jgi:hypothetical protein